MATVDATTLRNIYYERYATLVNTTESFIAWRNEIVDADAGTPTNDSIFAWYMRRFDSAAEADIRRQIGILIEEENLEDEFTAHIWEGEVMFDRTPLPAHITDDDDDYEQPEMATDPQVPVAPEAEDSDDPSSTEEEEEDHPLMDEYIEWRQRSLWQGDDIKCGGCSRNVIKTTCCDNGCLQHATICYDCYDRGICPDCSGQRFTPLG